MAAKRDIKLRLWDDSYVQFGFPKVIGCDKLDMLSARCAIPFWTMIP